jgi:hypothetical protein
MLLAQTRHKAAPKNNAGKSRLFRRFPLSISRWILSGRFDCVRIGGRRRSSRTFHFFFALRRHRRRATRDGQAHECDPNQKTLHFSYPLLKTVTPSNGRMLRMSVVRWTQTTCREYCPTQEQTRSTRRSAGIVPRKDRQRAILKPFGFPQSLVVRRATCARHTRREEFSPRFPARKGPIRRGTRIAL